MEKQSKIEQFWYQNKISKWLFFPISLLVKLIALTKRYLYLSGLFKSKKCDVPIIVVGNITVGGTGKTPFINYLVEQLQARGKKVGIISRGYQSNAPSYPHIVKASDSAEIVGDEAFMQFENCQIPIAIGANRIETAEALTREFSLDIIISDDGLQHYAMQRDFEILMVDVKRMFGNQLMLPFGPLREPMSRINSTDYIIFNQNQRIQNNQQLTHYYGLKTDVAAGSMSLMVEGLVNLKSGKMITLDEIKNTQVTAVAGIGNPQRFFDSLSNYYQDFEQLVFPDHHQFKLADFSQAKYKTIVMTEKDAVKCYSFAKDSWYFLKVSARLESANFEQLYELISHKIEA